MTDGLARVLEVENVAGVQTRSQGRDQYQRVEGTVEDPCRKVEKNIARIDKLAMPTVRSEEEKARTIEQIEEAEERMRLRHSAVRVRQHRLLEGEAGGPAGHRSSHGRQSLHARVLLR